MFASLINKLREYVTEKRLEANFGGKKNADDMDIGGVEEKEEEAEEQQHEHQHEEQQYDGWGYPIEYPSDINSFGNKGWGKQAYKGSKGGKGGKGPAVCYNCGKPGHIARDCPNPPAEGKGKGPQCYNCGESGHIARNCPYPQKGYGKSKGTTKGYEGYQKGGWGKGIHEFGYPPAHPLSPFAQNQGWSQPSGFSLGGGMNPNMR